MDAFMYFLTVLNVFPANYYELEVPIQFLTNASTNSTMNQKSSSDMINFIRTANPQSDTSNSSVSCDRMSTCQSIVGTQKEQFDTKEHDQRLSAICSDNKDAHVRRTLIEMSGGIENLDFIYGENLK